MRDFVSGDVNALIEIFYNKQSTIEQIQNTDIEMIQYIYKAQGTPLSTLHVHWFNKQSKVGVLHPEKLPPTVRATIQHSLCIFSAPWLDSPAECL